MEDDAADMASEDNLPLGIGASQFGSENGDEEDIMPQRTLPFSLGYSDPVGHIDRAESPASSYNSMHSTSWSDTWEDQEPTETQVHLDRRDSSASSSFSFNSDDEDVNMEENAEESSRKKSKSKDGGQKRQTAPVPMKPELQVDKNARHPAMTVDFAFKALSSCLKKLTEEEFKYFKKMLWERYPELFHDPLDLADLVNLVDKMLELCDLEVSLNITLVLLKSMNLKRLAEYLEGLCKRIKVRYELKLALKRKYTTVCQQGQPVPFESIYTDLYITDGINASVNIEHEFRPKIEDLAESKVNRQPLSSNDILAPENRRTRHVRSVVSKGSPGSGKSFAVQRFILDWTDDKTHTDIFFLLPLSFRELNQMLDKEYTLMDLIYVFYPEMKTVETLDFEGCPVMFICDGLDESQFPFEFRRTVYWCDTDKPASVQVLITNLIRGNLLYNTSVWVISRAGAIDVIPPEYCHQLLEVRGFNNDQREAYFRKTIEDPELAERVIAHIKASKTLYIMCHQPLFCWVASKVLQQQFQSLPRSADMPKTLTYLYTSLLRFHTQMCIQRLQNNPAEETKNITAEQMLIKLAKLSYSMLEKNEFQMEKEHFDEIEMDSYPAVVCSGLCAEYYREKFVMYQERVSCFSHPTLQEYMAALHVFYSFKKHGKNIFEQGKLKVMKVSLTDVLKSAVDKALSSKNCNFEIFLRFLLGLSVDANQELLKDILQISTSSTQQAREEMTRHIKKKIKENHYPEKNENLLRCIDELNPQLQR